MSSELRDTFCIKNLIPLSIDLFSNPLFYKVYNSVSASFIISYLVTQFDINFNVYFQLFLCSLQLSEPGSSVSTVSGYGLDDWAIEVRSPAEATGFFLYPLCPDRLCGPPNLLYNGYWGSFPRC
jgi:hypothetical protein